MTSLNTKDWVMDMAKKKSLKVQMLGGFYLEYDGKAVISKSNGKNKVLYFLEYIIANRHRAVPQNELIDILLGDEDSIDPAHTLKNLVYRGRKILSDAGLNEKEYIYFHSGAYGFTQKAPCVIDIEEFEKLVEVAQNSEDEEKRLKAGFNAIDLYKGDFLLFSYQQLWVIPSVVKYQNMYFAIVNMVSDLLFKREDYNALLTVTEKAISIYPYNEDFYIHRIMALQAMGKTKAAIREYEAVSAMLFDELGVTPSSTLRDLFFKITEGYDESPLTIEEALNDILIESDKDGAFYCNYYMFSNVCRYMVRYNERSGQSAFMVLCTITDKEDSTPNKDNLKHWALSFHKSVNQTLRHSDTYTRCRPNQFLILLMGTNQENSRTVMKRVENAFKKNSRTKGASLRFQFASHTDISKYMKEPDLNWHNK